MNTLMKQPTTKTNMSKQHQTITLHTDNGHAPEIIERFNRVAKQYDLTELPILLQSWMDDQDIADFAGMLEERLVLSVAHKPTLI